MLWVKRFAAVDRFDVAVLFCVACLITVIGLVILRGDQVGISVANFVPRDSASSQAAIRVTFDEPVDLSNAETYLTINPPAQGKWSTAEKSVTFQPAQALQVGQVYTVRVQPGLVASTGRRLKQALEWTFRIRAPRIVYLGPADGLTQDLYMVDPASPGSPPQQLTHSSLGISGYDVLPDGSKIVYSQLRTEDAASLFVLDVATGHAAPLYECKDATCNNPVWRPDGSAIAFERVELNTSTTGRLSAGVPRVWVFDLATNAAHPLFSDNQKLGLMPRWSPDGSQLAVYDGNAGGIMLHNVASGQDTLLPAYTSEFGSFSPDGKWLYYPRLVTPQGGGNVSHLVVIDLTTTPPSQRDLLPDGDTSDDVASTWKADSRGLIVVRRVRNAAGVPQPPHVYRVDLATSAATHLVTDDAYSDDAVSVSPGGGTLLWQRFPLNKPGARPELWLYDLATRALKQIAVDGMTPRWLP